MRPERYSYSYASRSGATRSLKERMWIVFLVLLALVLLVMGARGTNAVAQFRARAIDVLAPVMETVTIPVQGLRNALANKDAFFKAYEENKQLREENDRLRHWQAVAAALKVENDNLRALAAYKPVGEVTYVAAKVIAQSPDAYAGSLMINAGAAEGLKSLQPVVDAHGLVGRVVELGDHAARVLLLSDSASRVPVITGTSRQHAILAGMGDELLRLTFVGGSPATIQLGEAVMTTSEGGLMPDSVMVGTVFRRDGEGLLVKPARPLSQSEYVRVMVAR